MSHDTPCYVYGIVRAAHAGDIPVTTGVSGAPVITVSGDGVAAVVSALDDVALRANRADLLAHSDVLQQIVDRCDVAPVRFGNLYRRVESVRQDLLVRDAPALRRVLDELRGTVEMHLKASYDQDAVVAEVVRSDRRLQRLRNGRQDHARQLELGQRFASVLAARRETDAAQIVDRIGRVASRASSSDPAGDYGVADVAFLVDRAAVSAFLEEAERVADGSSVLTVRTVGPMPPYSFVGDVFERAA